MDAKLLNPNSMIGKLLPSATMAVRLKTLLASAHGRSTLVHGACCHSDRVVRGWGKQACPNFQAVLHHPMITNLGAVEILHYPYATTLLNGPHLKSL